MKDVTRFTLPNGLRVLHHFNPGAAMAMVDVLYDVGSRDESPDRTGMAHLFEHLMFGGSVNIPDYDGELQRAGGMSNAWTSQDFTNFYDILPCRNIETALWLESDRMLSLAFSDKALQVQRSVVVEEFKQACLNRPYGDMEHHLKALCYRVHPYRYPVIGKEFSHIEGVTQDDVRAWFSAHYAPGNAILAASCDIPADEFRRMVERWFADIPSREVPRRELPAEPVPTEPRYKEVSGDVPQTCITIAYPMARYGVPAYFAADLVSDVLSNGRSSRFYRGLLAPGRHFSDVDCCISGTEDPGLMLVTARLLSNGPQAEEEARKAIDSEIARLIEGGVADDELRRCLNRLESSRMFDMVGMMNRVQTLVMAEYHGEDPATAFESNYLTVTADDVRSTAEEIFNPSRAMTLVYRPDNG
ncbi:MAG: insulinase family protein [Muribaculaceae bacterium]|nr:insulinase family protein [Muribaculaceae bacterium]